MATVIMVFAAAVFFGGWGLIIGCWYQRRKLDNAWNTVLDLAEDMGQALTKMEARHGGV